MSIIKTSKNYNTFFITSLILLLLFIFSGCDNEDGNFSTNVINHLNDTNNYYSNNNNNEMNLLKVIESRDVMGTYMTITLFAESEINGKKAISDAFIEVERIENLFSQYKNSSITGKLNQYGFVDDVSYEYYSVIKDSIVYGEITDGAFDITVQPILDLYSISFQNFQRPPSKKEIEEELNIVDYNKIAIDGLCEVENISCSIRIDKNMKITLGAIAKGYAIDKVLYTLREKGFKNILVNAGGDMRGIGKKADGEPWNIALENPDKKGDYLLNFNLINKAIATSGNYERYFNENKSFHHIVNPKTGYSAQECISVTIIAKTAMQADIMATSIFVLGPDKGIEMIEKYNDIEGLIVTKNREIIKSSGFVK
jgi:thiamine biosynthesis lipoprotein